MNLCLLTWFNCYPSEMISFLIKDHPSMSLQTVWPDGWSFSEESGSAKRPVERRFWDMSENEGSILSGGYPESSSPPVHISWEGEGGRCLPSPTFFGQPFPSPADPGPGIELRSPALQTDSLPSEPLGKPFLMWGQGQFIYVRKDGDFNLKLYLILSQEKNHSGQESCKKNWNWLVVEWWLTGIGGWRKCGGKGQRMQPLSYKMNKFGRPKIPRGAHI